MRRYDVIANPTLPWVFPQVDGWSTGPPKFRVSQLGIKA